MEFIDAQSRDLLFILGFNTKDIKYLQALLDRIDIVYDQNDEEEVAMVDYLNKKLYPTVTWICKQYGINMLGDGNDVSTN
jgi:hypothetical protein